MDENSFLRHKKTYTGIQKKIFQWLLLLILLSAVAWGLRFFLLKNRGFALYKICSSLVFNPSWEVPALSEEEKIELKKILNQPFRFLDKGAQSYVFLSQDERYVIKFFKLHSLQPPMWFQAVQFPWPLQYLRISKILEKRQALAKTFSSYKIAYDELKEETGLVFMHLNKTHCLHHILTVVDNLGISHRLDLDQMEFFVQKRASLFYPFLEKTLEEKKEDGAKKIISNLVQFLVLRNQKEIFDKDPDLATNFGFLNDKIIQIDIGRFRKDPLRKNPDVYHSEILRITDTFNTWLKMHFPTLSNHLEKEIANLKKNENF